MAHETFEVIDGPGNFDLMLALFGEGKKILKFKAENGHWHEIEIDEMKRMHHSDNVTWLVGGTKQTNHAILLAKIDYRSDKRKGTLHLYPVPYYKTFSQ